jgi:hypothetical protein
MNERTENIEEAEWTSIKAGKKEKKNILTLYYEFMKYKKGR